MPVQGQLNEIDVSSILQMLCIGKRRSVLRLSHRSTEGKILIDHGQIVHAAIDNLEGEEAFFRLVTWRDGTFQISEPVASPTKTIDEDWDALLCEGARRAVAQRLQHGWLSSSKHRSSLAPMNETSSRRRHS